MKSRKESKKRTDLADDWNTQGRNLVTGWVNRTVSRAGKEVGKKYWDEII